SARSTDAEAAQPSPESNERELGKQRGNNPGADTNPPEDQQDAVERVEVVMRLAWFYHATSYGSGSRNRLGFLWLVVKKLVADDIIGRAVASVLSLLLCHVFAVLCVAIPPRAWTVIHTRTGVHPDPYIRIPCTPGFWVAHSSILLLRGDTSSRRAAFIPVGRTVPVLLGPCFGHKSAACCCAGPSGAKTVIDAGARVDPYADFFFLILGAGLRGRNGTQTGVRFRFDLQYRMQLYAIRRRARLTVQEVEKAHSRH